MLDSSAGRYFHAKVLKFGYLSDVFVGTALVDMYSKYCDMVGAEGAFQEIAERNLVSFNALITGFSLIGKYEESLGIYVNLLAQNLRPDCITFTGLFSAVSQSSNYQEVRSDTDITLGNTIVTFYSKCGFMDSALKCFEPVTRPNIVSWAGIISGFAQNGDSEKAIEYFCKMHKLGVRPDEFSFTSALKAVASSASAKHGSHIDAFVIKIGLESDVLVGSALVDVYSKCGMVVYSYRFFNEMPEKNVVSWNSIIMGFAHHGNDKSGLIPTSITFTAVLFACGHAGVVEEGLNFYETMVSYCGISPSVEHCTCLVDLLGLPHSCHIGLWRSLLAACGAQKNVELGVRAAEECLRLEPQDSATYVTLSNIYASQQL
ncbi:hypothetical protein MKX01_032969 [Papaver californicum]|nr:hypothetical protein MKX01_032969 [Papaver californicum]